MTKEHNGTENHSFPKDCPFVDDHDQIIEMGKDIKAILFAIHDPDNGILKNQRVANGRTKKLEMWRAGVVGALSILGPIVGFLAYEIARNHSIVERMIKP